MELTGGVKLCFRWRCVVSWLWTKLSWSWPQPGHQQAQLWSGTPTAASSAGWCLLLCRRIEFCESWTPQNTHVATAFRLSPSSGSNLGRPRRLGLVARSEVGAGVRDCDSVWREYARGESIASETLEVSCNLAGGLAWLISESLLGYWRDCCADASGVDALAGLVSRSCSEDSAAAPRNSSNISLTWLFRSPPSSRRARMRCCSACWPLAKANAISEFIKRRWPAANPWA